jgi:CBS domain-containing protein
LVPLSQLGVVTGPFIERLLVVNVLLIVFNMIPAFPMDGGRCVRALLALRLEYAQATRIAAWVGQAIAVGFVVLGLFSNPFLLLIGVFVWLGAAQEARFAMIKAALRGVPAQRALLRSFPILAPTDSLARVADAFETSALQKAVVVERGRVVGTISALDVVAHLPRRGPTTPVAEVMQRGIQTLELPATLDAALTRLHEARAAIMPVISQGRFVGAITLDQLDRFVAIQTALQRHAEQAANAGPGSVLTARPASTG